MRKGIRMLSKRQPTWLLANAVAKAIPSEPVQGICDRLNMKYGLKNDKAKKQKELTRTTVYQYVKDGLAGKSPTKRGLPPLIPAVLLDIVAKHAEVCQVGDGERRAAIC